MALTSGKEVQSIVRFAARTTKSPSTFGERELKAWCEERIQAGRTFSACGSNMSHFRSLMSRPELCPAVRVAPKAYGTPLRNMQISLRTEVEELLSFFTDKLEFDRSGPPIRRATVENLQTTSEGLVGFVENIQGRPLGRSTEAFMRSDIPHRPKLLIDERIALLSTSRPSH